MVLRLMLSRCWMIAVALEVGIGRRDVVQALVVALMIVMLDERFDLGTVKAMQRRFPNWLAGFQDPRYSTF